MKIREMSLTAQVTCEFCAATRTVVLADYYDPGSFSDIEDIIREDHPCPCLKTAEPDWFDAAKEAELSQT